MLSLGIDTGGTFTDFVLYDGSAVRTHKVLSTPHAPEEAILQGIRELGVESQELTIVHGSTVATNAILEGKGARVAYITNRGLRDLLTIGRQDRRELYALQPPPTTPPVAEELCLETGGRLGADGGVVEPLGADDLQRLGAALERLAPEAVAINLLFSFLDDRFERRIEEIIAPEIFVSRSSRVLPEYREYERGITTWLNARVGPLVARYLARLTQRLGARRVAVMQSSGGTIGAAQAGEQAVHMLLSGPAGGLAGARHVAATSGVTRLLTLDMGGTSTDVALIDGAIRLTNEGAVGPYPVAVPMVDMHTIGTGGGSLARVDAGGMLQVGPESAGADPGPVCYRRGGRNVTVTDANLVLGRLQPDFFLGGRMMLDLASARAALEALGAELGLDPETAADGVVRIANERMAHALRVISIKRGYDPREFTLVAFGGAGGLHVCELAEALGMTTALIPVQAGVLSALGMLVAPRARHLSRTVGLLLGDTTDEEIESHFTRLAAPGYASLQDEGVEPQTISAVRALDIRYRGQSATLEVPWRDCARADIDFHQAHLRLYGHRLDLPVEIVNVRVALTAPQPEVPLASPEMIGETIGGGHGAARSLRKARLHGIRAAAPIYARTALPAGRVVTGPALVIEEVATTYVAPNWSATVDAGGNLILRRERIRSAKNGPTETRAETASPGQGRP